VSIPICEDALAKFLAPDPYSRSKEYDGRRIREIPGGWWLVNHGKYRAMANKEDQNRQNVQRVLRCREKKRNAMAKADSVNGGVNGVNGELTKVNDIAEAEAEAEAEAVKKTKEGAKPKTHPTPQTAAAGGDFASLDFPEFKQTWERWEQARREMKKPLTPSARNSQLRMLATVPADATAIIERSIQNQWQGLFPLDHEGKRFSQCNSWSDRGAGLAPNGPEESSGGDESMDAAAERIGRELRAMNRARGATEGSVPEESSVPL
jgi:hypothetical protein